MLLIIEALLLISAALVKDHRAAADEPFPLDMQLNSVDDDFENCENDMIDLVEAQFLPKEKETKAWQNDASGSKQNAAGSKQQASGSKQNAAEIVLKKNELKAIHIWTGKTIFGDFNKAVRSGKQKYKDKTYEWYTLHFFLTRAIQKLKKTQNECVTTYRRTHSTFVKENVINTEVRFGSFAASSLDQQVISGFGDKSCFEIYTCYGAELTKYSQHPKMKEVLIPPYETFKVTEVKEKTKKNNLWCDTVYKLRSFEVKSELRCAIVNTNNSENK